VIVTLSITCLFSVRPAYLWELVQKIYESRTLLSFATCIMVLMGYDAETISKKCKRKVSQRIGKQLFLLPAFFALAQRLVTCPRHG